jgi:pimeloyl-ACP methyl ester carboxylesterase
MLHMLPGSSRQLKPVMAALAPRHCLAPDMAGTGDSGRIGMETPTIADYAHDTADFIRAVAGDRPVDVYGTHTGACLAIELAVQAPALVRRVVLEGIPMFATENAGELAARYAPRIEPDYNGAHLLWANNFCRDQILFYPWYEKSDAAARGFGMPPVEQFHDWVLEVIKGLPGIPDAYHAAFAYPTAERLAKVTQPVLCLAPRGDSLFEETRDAIGRLAKARLVVLEGHEADWQGAEALGGFLDCPDHAL